MDKQLADALEHMTYVMRREACCEEERAMPDLISTQLVMATEALDKIQALMDGNEWDSSTTQEIARILEQTGRECQEAM